MKLVELGAGLPHDFEMFGDMTYQNRLDQSPDPAWSQFGQGTFLSARTRIHVVSILTDHGEAFLLSPADLADLAPVTGMDPKDMCARTLADHREYKPHTALWISSP